MQGIYTITTDNTEGHVAANGNGVRKRHPEGEVETSTDNKTAPPVDKVGIDLLYGVTDYPPIHITIIYGIQLALINVSFSVTVAIIIAKTFCASPDLTAKITSTTLFMAGISTMLQTAVGIRLPMFQGPNPTFLVPLLNMATLPEWQCLANGTASNSFENGMSNSTIQQPEVLDIDTKMQMVAGSLLAASFIHAILGASGLMGLLMRRIGPLTVAPVITLVGITLIPPAAELSEAHWGVTAFTCLIFIILTAYLENVKVPIPVCTRKEGCHTVRYPVFQILAIVVSLGCGWSLSYILTEEGIFTDNRKAVEWHARTDSEAEAIAGASWFYFPYPGQFGTPLFSLPLFLGFTACVVMSIVESLGDYFALSNICSVSNPPSHALNRGILMEGLGSIFSAVFGAAHGTTSYSEMISTIGLTKVGCRIVFVTGGFIMAVLGVVGKFSAVLINIPWPVLGGLTLLTLGTLVGMGIAALESVNLNASRNVVTIGMSLVLGILIPAWVQGKTEDGHLRIQTGVTDLDHVLLALLGNSVFVGGFLGFLLDNTLPGKLSSFDDNFENTSDDKHDKIYELPFVPRRVYYARWTKYVPFIPHYEHVNSPHEAE